MWNWLYRAAAKVTGKNLKSTPPDVIIDQMNEQRPLPMGMTDFEEWSTRMISGALIPGGKDDPEVFYDSQKFALANMLMHLGPTESHKPDAFFIHSLRKFAVNQVADAVRKELHAKAKARTEAEEKAKAAADEAEAESDEPLTLTKLTTEDTPALN